MGAKFASFVPRTVLAGLQGRCEAIEALVLRRLGELDDENRVLGGQTDQHDETDLRKKRLTSILARMMPVIAANRHKGTIRMIAIGKLQLSY